MNPKLFTFTAVVFALIGLYLAACSATQMTSPIIRDDVGRLMKHPEYEAAFRAAPNFTHEALTTAARLDHELNAAAAQGTP